jgi:cellulose synthase (UDP-forming)
MNTDLPKIKRFFFLSILFLTFISIFSYLCARIVLILTSRVSFVEGVLAITLLWAEAFILIHSLGYFLNVFRVINHSDSFNPIIKEPHLESYPPVAIVVASYKEPLDILKDTLVCFYNLSYPNKHLYFLDDTRYDLPWDTDEKKLEYRKAIEDLCQSLDVNLFRAKWHGAKAGKLNDFLLHISGKKKEGFEFYPYAKIKSEEPEKYIIVFDADMNPLPDFVEYLVDVMEKRPKVAFTQTPQYYTNFEFNRVARASGLQQAIFYEFICEGKSQQGAMFCCGTNIIYRREALEAIGGFDEESVTEDFATSLKLHKGGWESLYLNRVSAFGMGPEDLGSFFKQQFRWARGTIGVFRTLPKELFLNFRKYSINQWWEYFLSSTHYFVGVVFFIMVSFPTIYLFFNTPSYLADPVIYASAFLPYITLTALMFFWTLRKRHYGFFNILSVFIFNAVSFPVFIKAAFSAMLGIKTSFGVTPKSGSTILSFCSLMPQIIISLVCVSAGVWGIMRLYYEREPFYGLILNVFWTFYNFLLISSFLYFNHAEEDHC